MGLAEKKIQQDFIDNEIPKNLKYFAERTGGATANLQVEIDWASLGNDAAAYEGLKSVWLQPLQGIEAVCSDEVGKSGVKQGLKKIVIKNVSGGSSVEIKDGVLTASLNLRDGSGGGLG